MPLPQPAPGLVVSCRRGESEDPRSHERVTRSAIARRIAALKGYEYGGEYEEARQYDAALYFVPGRTLSVEAARALGIRDEDSLFGGVVPFRFVGTKTITHTLIGPGARAPAGWSSAFAQRVLDAVLPGYAAFSTEDAREAGRRLLERGAVRVKPALALGGRGQTVAEEYAALAAAVAEIDPAELAQCGVALEQNMSEVVTYSVGQVRVGALSATYFGTQKLVADNGGAEVYGGSDLTVARGDFDALLELDIDPEARLAIEQARTYDIAARECFAGFFASRRNYDIVSGRDAHGRAHSGVLEQSWRIGGASGAEIAALEAFSGDPALRAVRAECTETYGAAAPEPPADATVYFRGVDPVVGFITKFTTVQRHADA